MADLEKKFEMAVERRKLQGKTKPRPGVYVPLEFASQDRVRVHEELGEDFVRRVLDLEWAWISDESSLWNFHTDENNDRLNAKIIEVYGVDVSDLEDAKLFDIFDRIASSQAKKAQM